MQLLFLRLENVCRGRGFLDFGGGLIILINVLEKLSPDPKSVLKNLAVQLKLFSYRNLRSTCCGWCQGLVPLYMYAGLGCCLYRVRSVRVRGAWQECRPAPIRISGDFDKDLGARYCSACMGYTGSRLCPKARVTSSIDKPPLTLTSF